MASHGDGTHRRGVAIRAARRQRLPRRRRRAHARRRRDAVGRGGDPRGVRRRRRRRGGRGAGALDPLRPRPRRDARGADAGARRDGVRRGVRRGAPPGRSVAAVAEPQGPDTAARRAVHDPAGARDRGGRRRRAARILHRLPHARSHARPRRVRQRGTGRRAARRPRLGVRRVALSLRVAHQLRHGRGVGQHPGPVRPRPAVRGRLRRPRRPDRFGGKARRSTSSHGESEKTAAQPIYRDCR